MAQQRAGLVSALAWIVLVGVAAVTAIALLSSRYGWPLYLELLSHFQRQYWLLSLVGWGVIGLTRRRWPALLGLMCVAALTTQLLPWYWPPHFLGARDTGNLRILISNVNTKNRNFDAVLNFVQQTNPDLALFMEVDNRWIEQLDPLTAELPYFSGEGNANNFGIVIYSRYPLTTTQLVNFAADSTPSITTTMTVHGQSLTVVGTHPVPPVRPTYFYSRNRQLDQLGQYLQSVEQPKIVIGDFNITMWSPYYRSFHRQTGLKNVRDGFGLLPSWPTGKFYRLPAWFMPLLAIPIDHGLVSPELTVTKVQVGPNVGSDHRPVVVDLHL
ncbi:MAG: endonuclease/exonuclease/phosphatase family protein [Cyanobacteria bacterium P01_F01_bin.56]